MKAFVLGLAVLATAVTAQAAETSRLIKPSEIRGRPTGDIAARYYPDRAQRMEVGGRVLLDCRVTPQGKAEDCQVQSETPPEYGFGRSALLLIPFFEFKPPGKKDLAKERVRRIVPINFAVPH
jgi:protein TonB